MSTNCLLYKHKENRKGRKEKARKGDREKKGETEKEKEEKNYKGDAKRRRRRRRRGETDGSCRGWRTKTAQNTQTGVLQ